MNADELLKRAKQAREALEETQEQKRQLAQLLRDSDSHEALDQWAQPGEAKSSENNNEQSVEADPLSLDCLTEELSKLNQKLERISLRTSQISTGAEQMGEEFAKSASQIKEIEKYRNEKQVQMANQVQKMTQNNDQMIDSTFESEEEQSGVGHGDIPRHGQIEPVYDPLEGKCDEVSGQNQDNVGGDGTQYMELSDSESDLSVADDRQMRLADSDVNDDLGPEGNQLPEADIEDSDTVIEENVNSHSLPLPVQHALPEPEDFDPDHDSKLERQLIITPPPGRSKTIKRRTPPSKILRRKSKKYTDQDYIYSWDIPYKTGLAIEKYEQVKLIRDDCGKSCQLSPDCLAKYMTEDTRVSNGRGGWNIKVFKSRQNEVAISPGKSNNDWVYMKINWKYGR